jgi:hypothetical protein
MSPARTRYNAIETDDDDPFDENGVLRDGRSVRFRLSDKNSLEGQMTQHFRDAARITDGYGNSGVAILRPGFRKRDVSDDDALARRQIMADVNRTEARDEMIDRMTGAWRDADPNINGAGVNANGPIGARAGDQCTLNGAPGTMQMRNGKLTCVPDSRSDDSARAVDKETVLNELEREMCEAWRNP